VSEPEEAGLEQRVAAYGLLVDDGRVLLVRAGDDTDVPGRSFLPGGGVEHGEDPDDTVRREFLEETGLVVTVGQVVGVWSEMIEAETRSVDGHSVEVHSVCIVFEIESWTGEVRAAAGMANGEHVSWEPIDDDDDARMEFVRAALRT
jgi:ADP-ribose pyrophosphatase YjhB (NUDIX family)